MRKSHFSCSGFSRSWTVSCFGRCRMRLGSRTTCWRWKWWRAWGLTLSETDSFSQNWPPSSPLTSMSRDLQTWWTSSPVVVDFCFVKFSVLSVYVSKICILIIIICLYNYFVLQNTIFPLWCKYICSVHVHVSVGAPNYHYNHMKLKQGIRMNMNTTLAARWFVYAMSTLTTSNVYAEQMLNTIVEVRWTEHFKKIIIDLHAMYITRLQVLIQLH